MLLSSLLHIRASLALIIHLFFPLRKCVYLRAQYFYHEPEVIEMFNVKEAVVVRFRELMDARGM